MSRNRLLQDRDHADSMTASHRREHGRLHDAQNGLAGGFSNRMQARVAKAGNHIASGRVTVLSIKLAHQVNER